ncbi:MAG TPA: RagB/SusD family nutrient uptake outer membrane protein [Saprospirales bacterium]|nr:RagB/SusD family nutrient uptake outer membrane protein [Saprospirales bacterium]HAY71746.1 RagB/SusD family nutrient uptake outer membrane protein [Saprospirales bacterium]HRQ29998.1 RagB/SusD family nutrient uptake outer membrane protein [Saprospiraceae bacterium]
MKNIFKIFTLFMISSLFLTSCYRDEYLNPSQASNESVVSSTAGLISLCNGLQYRYTVSRTSPVYSFITANGLTTNEILVLNQGNTDEANLQAGKGNVLGNNAVVTRLWEQSHIVRANADLILNNTGILGDPGTKNAVLCYAHLYKGLALLQLGTYWESAPVTTEKNAAFVPRTEVLAEAIKNFEAGLAAANGNPVFSTAFQSGIDFKNTFAALLARTYIMVGNYDKAIENADKVDLTKKSEWVYDDVSRNPIFDVSYSNVNVCEPVDFNLGLTGSLVPAETDARVLFYLKSKTFTTTVNEGKGFFTANSAKIPVYLPGEVILTKAEALARKNDLTGAVTELNKVLTKTNDVFGVNANLPAYSGENTASAILAEIYRNRCIELYNSGLKLEDSRRFGRPGPNDTGAERNRNFYPFPNSERDNNTNTPADPEI